MLTAAEIAGYRAICLSLPGGEILDRYTDEQAAEICNGVGAAWMDQIAPHASAILNRLNPWAIASSIIHDLVYHEGQGGAEGRAQADYNFWLGCRQCIEWCSDYRITRWWRERKASAMYYKVRQFGWLAWGTKSND